MEQYHRKHNNVFLCVALPRHVNTQSNQVELLAYHSSTLHPHIRTRTLTHFHDVSDIFQLDSLVCDTYATVPRHTQWQTVKRAKPHQIGLCWGVIPSFSALENSTEQKCVQKQLCYWNKQKENGKRLDFPQNLYAAIILNGAFTASFLSSFCSAAFAVTVIVIIMTVAIALSMWCCSFHGHRWRWITFYSPHLKGT